MDHHIPLPSPLPPSDPLAPSQPAVARPPASPSLPAAAVRGHGRASPNNHDDVMKANKANAKTDSAFALPIPAVPTPFHDGPMDAKAPTIASETTPLLLHHTLSLPCHLANPTLASVTPSGPTLLPAVVDVDTLPSTIPPRLTRVPAIDLVRGLIIILMSLDHARKYLSPSVTLDPLRPGAEEEWAAPLPSYAGRLAVFGTRVVTHLAAPGFFFLMGLGAVLFARSRLVRGWSAWQVCRHGLVRGGVLVALAGSVLNDGIMFRGANPSDKQLSGVRVSLGVMYALGVNFMLTIPIAVGVLRCRATQGAPGKVAGGLAASAVGLSLVTEAVVGYYKTADASLSAASSTAWMLTFVPTTRGVMQVMYPVLPWLSPALWGIGYGVLTRGMPTHQLTRLNWLFSFACLFPFLVLRIHGRWGNIQVPPSLTQNAPGAGDNNDLASASDPWTSATLALIRFFTLVKYPPSIAFLLCTLSALHAILAVAYNPKSVLATHKYFVATVLTVFGQSSLFFYLAHVLLYFAAGVFVRKCIVEQGLGLPGMFGLWVLGLVVLFFACRRYARFKHSTEPESLWRLF